MVQYEERSRVIAATRFGVLVPRWIQGRHCCTEFQHELSRSEPTHLFSAPYRRVNP